MKLVDNTGGVVAEPDWTSIYSDELEIAAAHEHWRVLTDEMLGRSLLSPANAHSLRRLVIAYLAYERAAREVAEKGAVVQPRRGNSKAIARINPWFTALREAGADAMMLEAKLGLAPRDRNAAGKVERGSRRSRAADAYLKPVSR